MSSDHILSSLVAKYKGKWLTDNYNTTITAGAGGLLTYTILRPWVFYMTSMHGYVSEQNVRVEMYDTDNNIMVDWERFMDTNTTLDIMPIIHDTRLTGKKMIGPSGNQYERTFLFYLLNSSANTTDVNIGVNGFIIEETQADAFEAEYKKLYQFGKGRD